MPECNRAMTAEEIIRSRPCPDCCVCGTRGQPLYHGLRDCLFGAPGEWNMKRCPNLDCGLLWLDPMPLEEDIAKAYQCYYTHTNLSDPVKAPCNPIMARIQRAYWANRFGYWHPGLSWTNRILAGMTWMFPGYRAQWDTMVFFLRPLADGRLLEIGCGSGIAMRRMESFGWRVEGLDFDPQAVKTARKANLKIHCGKLIEKHYANEIFDAIVMNHVVEHLHEPHRVLSECFRILKPGGKCVIITPNAISLGHRIFKESWRGLEPPRHLQVFTPCALKHLAIGAGFSTLRAFTTVSGAHGIFLASRASLSGTLPQMQDVYPTRLRILGRTFQYFEWLLTIIRTDIAEEIALIAHKDC